MFNPPARREEVLAARKKFCSSEGDHVTLLNIYRTFKKVSGNKVSGAGRINACVTKQTPTNNFLLMSCICCFRSGVGKTLSTAGTWVW